LGPRTWELIERLRRRNRDERGAELIEFAIVVVLLITLLYGIITFGLILAAQATVTQAAADAARAGIITSTSSAPTVAEAQACADVGWMDKTCVAPNSGSVTTCPSPTSSAITASACEEPCPSNTANTCLKVTVTYNYTSDPLFPELPGLGVITPSTISSTNVLEFSTPTSS
jgi:Flp pilus assembly protein TadG